MTSELTNKSPNDLRILLDTIKLRRNEFMTKDTDSEIFKSLVALRNRQHAIKVTEFNQQQ